MRKKYQGSFTVEAAILMPVILFIMMAVIYLLFFLHDSVILQSFAMRQGESLLWRQEEAAAGDSGRSQLDDAVLMMDIEGISTGQENKISDTLLGLAGSYHQSQVQVNGQMHIGIVGSTEFLGNALLAEVDLRARRIEYVDDYLKTTLLQKIRSGKSKTGE